MSVAQSNLQGGMDRTMFLAEHLFQMIPQDVWRAQGAEWMGHYEGDAWAESTRQELAELRATFCTPGSEENYARVVREYLPGLGDDADVTYFGPTPEERLRSERESLIKQLVEVDEQMPLSTPWWHFRTRRRLKKMYPIFSQKITRVNQINDELERLAQFRP